jgi:hypothetical protein
MYDGDLDNAGSTWTDVAGSAISISTTSGRSFVSVSPVTSYDGGANELANTSIDIGVPPEIDNAQIDINCRDWIWTDDNQSYLQDVLRHELGHCINLLHSSQDATNVMAPVISECGFPDILSAGEQIAVAAMYPNSVDVAYYFSPWRCCLRSVTYSGGPALLNQFVATQDSGCAHIEFATLYEDSVQGFVVSRVDSGTIIVEAVIDTLTAGASYGWYSATEAGEHEGSFYSVRTLESNGQFGPLCFTRNVLSATHQSKVARWESLAGGAAAVGTEYWRRTANGVSPVREVDKSSESAEGYVVVICAEQFAEEIAPLCALHEEQGYEVELVLVGSDPNRRALVQQAIRARHSIHPLTAVLLVGDACENNELDPVNLPVDAPPPPPINFIPAFYEESDCQTMVKEYYATDVPYGDVNDDGYLEIAVGRIPADSEEEVAAYVAKVMEYMGYPGLLPAEYGSSLIHCVPTTMPRCELPNQALTPTQAMIKSLGMELRELAIADGVRRVELIDTTNIPEWAQQQCPNDPLINYYLAARSIVGRSLAVSGAHVVIGVSEHFGSFLPYGLLFQNDWRDLTENRRTMSFFLWLQCLSGDYSGTNNYGYDYQPLCEYELFEQGGLVVVGPNGPSWNTLNVDIARVLGASVYERSGEGLDHVPLGVKYRECVNALHAGNAFFRKVLRSYQYLGDPLLYVRDAGVVTGISEDASEAELRLFVTPNPSRGRFTVKAIGLPTTGGKCDIYDVRGRLIRRLAMYSDGATLSALWDGRDSEGRVAGAGVYFVRARWTGREVVDKVMMIR